MKNLLSFAAPPTDQSAFLQPGGAHARFPPCGRFHDRRRMPSRMTCREHRLGGCRSQLQRPELLDNSVSRHLDAPRTRAVLRHAQRLDRRHALRRDQHLDLCASTPNRRCGPNRRIQQSLGKPAECRGDLLRQQCGRGLENPDRFDGVPRTYRTGGDPWVPAPSSLAIIALGGLAHNHSKR